MVWLPFVVAFAVSLVTTLVLTPLARIIACKLGAVDMPGNRRINTRPIPRMGGIAMLLGLVMATVVVLAGYDADLWESVLATSANLTVNYDLLATSILLIFLVGFVDDFYSLSPHVKLLGQVLAACLAASSGMVINNVTSPFAFGEISLGWVGYPLTVIYLVAYSNIINLIDGLDGLAAGVACLSSTTLFIIAFIFGRLDAAFLAIATAGASLAFLRYNFNPAVIFMGDSGALTLGFCLGCVSLLSVSRFAGLTTTLLPLVLAGIPIIDTFSAIVRRRRAHVSVGQADKGHIHHRLIQGGFNQRQAVVLIYLWTGALCIGSLAMVVVDVWWRIGIFLALLGFSILYAVRLKLFTPVLLHHYDGRGNDVLVTPEDPAFEEEAERQHIDVD